MRPNKVEMHLIGERRQQRRKSLLLVVLFRRCSPLRCVVTTSHVSVMASTGPVFNLSTRQGTDSFYLMRSGSLIEVPILTVCCCTSRNWGNLMSVCARSVVSVTCMWHIHFGDGSLQVASHQNQSVPVTVATTTGAGNAAAGEAVNDVIPSPSALPASGSIPPSSSCPGCAKGMKKKTKHYGAIVCDGCKSFFRRTVQKAIIWQCLHNSKCLITTDNKKCCKSCRYHRCESAGMRTSSLLPARGPYRRSPGKRHDPPPPSYSYTSSHSV